MKKANPVLFLIITVAIGMSPKSHAQWVKTNGPYEASVCSFASSDSSIFVGTIGAGVYRSTDNGMTWTPSNGGMTSTFTNCFAVSGNNIYAGSATGEGVSLSTDNGTTWTAANNGLPNFYSYALTGVIAELAASGSNVFAIINGGIVVRYLSTDNGSNWIDANTGTIPGISAIAVMGNNFFVGSSNGVYISTNSGTTWTAAGLTDSAITSFTVSGANLFANTNSGVFLSTNTGTTWTSRDSGLPNNGIVQLSASGSYIIAKTSVGFFLSTNNGTNWTTLATTGIPSNFGAAETFAAIDTNLYYGFLECGICRSTDNGKTWAVDNTGLEETDIFALTATRNTAFVITFDYFYASSQGSLDWVPIPNVWGLVAATTDSTVYTFNSRGVCYSSDDGKTWTTPLNAGIPSGFQYTALAAEGTDIFLGGAGICGLCDQGGVYLSTNSGANWNKKGLANISLLADNGTNIYAVMLNAILYVSTDLGSTWNTLSAPPVNALAFRDSEMFVGSSAGVLRSTTGGKQWESIDSGLPDSAQWVTCLAVRGTHVFAGTTVGVYVLNNDDTSWTAVNTGLPLASSRVSNLVATDSDLYAGVNGTIWKLPISEMITAVKPPSTSMPTTFWLAQNFPNPFNPSTTIDYQIPNNTLVTLKVYDELGRLVKTLVEERQTAGAHSLTFNASNLSSGVYFYRLAAGSFVQTKKLMLLK